MLSLNWVFESGIKIACVSNSPAILYTFSSVCWISRSFQIS